MDDDEAGEHGEHGDSSGDVNPNNLYDAKKGYSSSKEKNYDD